SPGDARVHSGPAQVEVDVVADVDLASPVDRTHGPAHPPIGRFDVEAGPLLPADLDAAHGIDPDLVSQRALAAVKEMVSKPAADVGIDLLSPEIHGHARLRREVMDLDAKGVVRPVDAGEVRPAELEIQRASSERDRPLQSAAARRVRVGGTPVRAEQANASCV